MNNGQPLANMRIVVTRAEEQSGSVATMLSQLGAHVLLVPTIRIEAAELSPDNSLRISNFRDYDAIIFTSINSVKKFFPHVKALQNFPERPFVVSIGKKTAEALEEAGLAPDLISGKSNTQDLLKSLGNSDWGGKKVLIPTGNLSSTEIADFVKSRGGIADEVVVYNTLPNDAIGPELRNEVASGQFDVIVFYSPSQVKNFIYIFGAGVLAGKRIAVIGPTTKKAVERHDLQAAVIPDNSTTEDLVSTLVEYEKNR